MPPAVIDALDQFRRDLDAGETETLRTMASRWLQVERALEADAHLAAQALADLHLDGWAVTPALAQRQERVRTLLAQTRVQVDKYAAWADGQIARRQRSAIAAGVEAGTEAIQATAGVALQFDRLPVEALENLIGFAGDGSPLHTVLRDAYGHGANGILDILVTGAARGKGPRELAREAVRQGLSRSLDHMMTVMRSETLRPYREATRQSYIRSGVVVGYYRVAAKSTRTCIGCLVADGQFFTLDVAFEEHAKGRCTLRPAILGAPEQRIESGAEWFERQSDETKLKMLGPTRMELYQRGLPFERFGTRRENPRWGASHVPATISEVVEGRNVSFPSRARSVPQPPAPELPPYDLQFLPSDEQRELVLGNIRTWASWVAREGETADDVLAKAMTAMEELTRDVPVSTRFKHKNLDSLLTDGRFKSQFETGTSGGFLGWDVRADAEFKGLGYPHDIDPALRPIYGYLDLTPGAYHVSVSGYGDLQFVFKPEVRQRTTFTMGDSLGNFELDAVLGTPVNAPELGSADQRLEALLEYTIHKDAARLVERVGYVEAQIQGQPSLRDVAYVIDRYGLITPEQRQALERFGVEVRRTP